MENSIVRNYWSTFRMYSSLRNELMETLTDADLAFRPGGENPTLGELCLEIGEVQHAYIESFSTWRIDFSYRHPDRTAASSVAALVAWYDGLDVALGKAIVSLSEEDIENRTVDRGPHFKPSALTQLMVYQEALLIFHGKVSVYLKAMGKAPTERFLEWIG